MLFAGDPHVACSISCYTGVGQIEIFGTKERHGKLLKGLRLMDRSGQTLVDIGETEVHHSGITFDEHGKAQVSRQTDKREKIKKQTVDRIKLAMFERIIGVKSRVQQNPDGKGHKHFDLRFVLASELGDVTSIVPDFNPAGKLQFDEEGLVVNFIPTLPSMALEESTLP